MLERFKRDTDDSAAAAPTGAVGTAERPDATPVREPGTEEQRLEEQRVAVPAEGAATASVLATARARQRDEFGGVNWGASGFGWLVAVGVAALLTALLASAGASIGLTVTDTDVSTTDEIGLGGGIALVVVLMLAYYAGGYVAGRMSRFDGGRQGLATWAVGLIVMVALAAVGAIAGAEYNVLGDLNLPALPVGDQSLAGGGWIALVAILAGTIVAAMAGGKVGERYHKRVDRAGFTD
jgi:hypothetical protein